MTRLRAIPAALVLVLGASPAFAATPAIDAVKVPEALKQLFGDKLDPFAAAFSISHSGDVTRVTID